MILVSPGAEAFSIFGLAVYWYGIIMAISIVVGTFVADWIYRKRGGDGLIWDLIPWLAIVGFAGARVYYCILNWQYYISRPLAVLNVREGGLSIHGAMLACLIFLLIYTHRKKINFFDLAAPIVLGLALAQSIGRWGNFFNSEAFGKPAVFTPIKLFIPEALRPLQFQGAEYFHPAFLYESVLDFIIFLVLLRMIANSKSSLFITSLYFVLYALARIIVESVRIDSIAYIAGIPFAIWISVLILIVAIWGLVKSRA